MRACGLAAGVASCGDGGGGADARTRSDPCPVPVNSPKIPLAIVEAPKMMKQPSTTCAARRTSMRPESIRKPTAAMAITAIAVAIVPSRVPLSHSMATVIARSFALLIVMSLPRVFRSYCSESGEVRRVLSQSLATSNVHPNRIGEATTPACKRPIRNMPNTDECCASL